MGLMKAVMVFYAGISFAVGCIYLMLALRRIERSLHLLFACLSLSVTFNAALTIAEYDAASVAQYDAYLRIQIWFTAAISIFLVLFMSRLAGLKNRLVPAALSVYAGALVVIRFFHPTFFIYRAVRGLKEYSLVTGERIRLLDADPSPGYVIIILMLVLLWLFLLWCAVRLLRRRERRHGAITLFSALVFILFPLNDVAVNIGLYPGVFIAELGTAGFVLLMGLGLADNVILKERMRLELARTSETLERIVAHIPSLVLVRDSSGRLVIANSRVFEFLGVPPRPCEALEKNDIVRALLAPPSSGAAAGSFSLHLNRGHEEFEFLNVQFPIPDAAGPGRSLGVVATDISALIRMEADLRQSEKLRALGFLAGGVAHDFNNQLTSILGFTELLEQGTAADPELGGYTRAIMQAIERSREMIARLLAFARKGGGQPKPLRLNSLVGDTLTLLEHSLNKNIEIRRHLAEEDIIVRGDRTQLQNALLNLALNARDAMPRGGRLFLRLKRITIDEVDPDCVSGTLKPGDYAALEVEDTGAGIPPEVLPRIFEPFFTTKPEGEGTGMGLAAVQGTIRQHGGSISVRSRPGAGACFSIRLPMCREEEAGGREPRARPVSSPRGWTAWVVDDEELIRDLIKAMLAQEGCTVRLFGSGDELLAALERALRENDNPPRAVVLDMVLPGVPCRDIIARLRESQPSVPIVLISGFTKEQDIQSLLAFGNIRFLQKPFRKADLLAALAEPAFH